MSEHMIPDTNKHKFLTVMQGTSEHDELLRRLYHSDLDTEPGVYAPPDRTLQRAAAHKRLMVALRNLDERTAA